MKKSTRKITLEEKTCSQCDILKPLSEFGMHKGTKDGHQSYCIDCQRKMNKNWNAKHYKTHKEEISKTKKEEYPLIKDKENSRRRRSYKTDNKVRNSILSQCMEYYCTLPGRFVHWKSGAKRRKIEFLLTLNDLENMPMICFFTGTPLTLDVNQPNTISLDRIDSTKGYVVGNIVFCCSAVNGMKMDLSNEQFLKWVASIHEFSNIKGGKP